MFQLFTNCTSITFDVRDVNPEHEEVRDEWNQAFAYTWGQAVKPGYHRLKDINELEQQSSYTLFRPSPVSASSEKLN